MIRLRHHSKIPPDNKWTEMPTPPWEEIEKASSQGFNIGVRLGSHSELINDDFESEGYVAVFDVDVKGSEPRHREEAYAALYRLHPQLKDGPHTVSGRGNGSAHFFCTTEKPVRGNELRAESKEIVPAKMPSVEPSKRDLDRFTPAEIAEGYRLRPAWDIKLMSEGRQVVLPGSVHPDTLQHYTVGIPITDKPLPHIRVSVAQGAVSSRAGVPRATPQPVRFTDATPEGMGLRPDQVAAIRDGTGVTDRSGSVFALTMAMKQRRVSEADILSIFTDKKNFLGHMAYDHAKTSDRQKAAQWLFKYTLPRARQQTVESAFAHEVQELPADGVTPGPNAPAKEWHKLLERQRDGKPRATFKNLSLILKNEVDPKLLKRDLFQNQDVFTVATPWGHDHGSKRSDADALKIKPWLIEHFGIEAALSMMEETLSSIALENSFHPVKDYLDKLQWDGVERMANAFRTYLRANMPEPYLSSVSKKFFLALIARIYQPGGKFDHLPVLEGKQGIGKSSFGRIVVGDKWFMDGLPDLADKDAALNLQGIWLCEMSELSSLYRAQLEVAKAFITRQTDKVRPPYGRHRVDYPRSNIFYGTTNDRDYLVDPTGNRRFWPVEVTGCDFKALARDREQLLAEAHWCYLTEMEPLYLEGKALKQAEAIQESRRVEDVGDAMRAKLMAWVETPPESRTGRIDLLKGFQIDELFDVGPFFGMDKNRRAAGVALKRAGFTRRHTRNGNLWTRGRA